MLVKKEVGMRKKKVLVMGIGILLLIVIVAIGFLYFRGSSKTKTYNTFQSITSNDISVFGENKQFVAMAGGWAPGKRYTISQEGHILYKVGGEYIPEHAQQKGEYFNLVIFDLEKEGYPSEKLDLYKVVSSYDSSYFPISSDYISHYQGPDYLLLIIRSKGETGSDKDKKVFLNLETHKISDIPEEYKIINSMDNLEDTSTLPLSSDVNATTLADVAKNNGYLLLNHLKKDGSDKETSKQGYDINLIKDNPQIKEIISKGGTVYPRQSMVSSEEWFNQMLHWLAPVGEKSLTIYPVDKPYADNAQPLTDYPIKSYQDYITWKENQKKE